MERFYQRLAKGESASSALRNAKLDMLATACFLILCAPEYLVQK